MHRFVRGGIRATLAVALGAFAVLSWSEARRASARNRLLEEASAAAAGRVVELTGALAAARAGLAARDERIEFLEDEVITALRRAGDIAEAAEGQRAEIEAARRALEEQRAVRRAPMPEGVRLALVALEDCLRADGFANLRFIEARALVDGELHEAELIERSADGRSVCYYRAGRLGCVLDREAGVLVLRMRDGHAVRDGRFEEFPEDGFELRFEGVYGPVWEQRLPYLVQGLGEYPAEAELGGRPEVLDPVTRARWTSRLSELLDLAQTDLRYRLGRFRTVRDGRFLDASLHAYDGGKLLAQSATVAALAVEVDRTVGSVSLLLEDGVLRKAGGETTIPKSGYRILLSGVTPERAIDAMLGFVVHRR